jgi:hypothetical protein
LFIEVYAQHLFQRSGFAFTSVEIFPEFSKQRKNKMSKSFFPARLSDEKGASIPGKRSKMLLNLFSCNKTSGKKFAVEAVMGKLR